MSSTFIDTTWMFHVSRSDIISSCLALIGVSLAFQIVCFAVHIRDPAPSKKGKALWTIVGVLFLAACLWSSYVPAAAAVEAQARPVVMVLVFALQLLSVYRLLLYATFFGVLPCLKASWVDCRDRFVSCGHYVSIVIVAVRLSTLTGALTLVWSEHPETLVEPGSEDIFLAGISLTFVLELFIWATLVYCPAIIEWTEDEVDLDREVDIETVPQDQILENRFGRTCTICLEDIEGEGSRLRCAHVFHDECIRMWLKSDERKRCPTCQRAYSLPPKQEEFIYAISSYERVGGGYVPYGNMSIHTIQVVDVSRHRHYNHHHSRGMAFSV